MNRISQAALRHRASIRRLMPKSLHHIVGTLARGFIRAVESADGRAGAIAAGKAPVQFPGPLRPVDAFRKNSVILVNDALSSGGSERQIVNTLVGLKTKSNLDARLLCWRLDEGPELRFYADDLLQAGVPFGNVSTEMSADAADEAAGGDKARSDLELREARAWLDENLEWIPPDVRDKIIRLTADLVRHRPGTVHGWQDEIGLVTAFAGILAGVPRIVLATRNVNPSGFGYHRPFMRAAYRIIASLPDLVFLNNSAAGARDYETWIGAPTGRFKVLYNGIDFSEIAPPDPSARAAARDNFGLADASKVIGTVIRFNQEKRPLLWVQTASRILARFPDVRFIMAGDGPMHAKTLAEAKRLGLDDRLALPGAVRPIGAVLQAMDVFLLTSQFEGLPNVTMEAGAAGLPVITTDAGGARETILIGETGLVVPEADLIGDNPDEAQLAEALANAVCTVLEDPAWTERALRLGPAFVRDNFSMDRMIAETVAHYAGNPAAKDT